MTKCHMCGSAGPFIGDAGPRTPVHCPQCGYDVGYDETPVDVIVSRHPAAIEWLREFAPGGANAVVISDRNATAEDVAGKVVAGNIPLHLAALCREVVAVEFCGDPPRGREYTIADMTSAKAVMRSYKVERVG